MWVWLEANSYSRVGRRGPRAPPWWQNFNGTQMSLSLPGLWKRMLPSAPPPPPHGGHLALYRGPKAQFWGELGQMSQCHTNRFEWPCNMSKWGHGEYDGDICILIGGLCNQQIQDGGQPPHWILMKNCLRSRIISCNTYTNRFIKSFEMIKPIHIYVW